MKGFRILTTLEGSVKVAQGEQPWVMMHLYAFWALEGSVKAAQGEQPWVMMHLYAFWALEGS